ncbi:MULTISPECIES: MATE family efflux transporter [Actinomyces]|uniref:MATE family efflux transporter n=1 Tax=Actinomyces respiraculi TaxID=2744574 RepID=A0A7T0PXE4_9ACTO|nr:MULTISPECIES: MATE family efflux transporter [Actinomyces]QPL06729.1 MATE family efflux transporter [Actinomyces respiraculi]
MLSLALPALGALVAEPLFVIIDSAMVGHLGATSLAGLSLASTVLTTVVGLFVFLAYATTATTSRLFGAGDRGGGLRAGVDGLWLAALLGVAAAVLLWSTAPWVAAALGADAEVARASVAYLRASAPGLPGMLVVYAATGTLRGLLDTRTPFVVATAGAVVNVGLNAIFLYAVGMGVAGSGLGTAITQTLMAAALTLPVVLTARTEGVSLAPRRAGLGASLGAGAPLLVRTLTLRIAILATVWTATALGEVPLAAHQVVNSLWGFTAFCLDALAIAAQALIGTALGQADAVASEGRTGEATSQPDKASSSQPGEASSSQRGSVKLGEVPSQPGRAGALLGGVGEPTPEPPLSIDAVLRRSLAWGVGTGALIGVVLAALAPWLPRLFSSDTQVVDAAVPVLLVAASALPLAGAVFLFDGVLMGAGDGVYLAKAGVVTLMPYLPLAVAVHAGWPAGGAAGLVWLWVAFAWVFMGARLVTTGLRTRTDAWRS